MHIWRRGAGRDHGNYATEVPPAQIFWDHQQKVIGFTALDVKDFTGEAHHHWTISISLKELQQMIIAAASAGDDTNAVSIEMAPALTSLLRLATEAAKNVTVNPQPVTQ